MRVRLITDNPEHPVLAEMAELLGAAPLSPDTAVSGNDVGRPADLYLLKSHTPAALSLGERLEAAGCRVVNSVASTAACQDRLQMARRLEEAGLPAPRVVFSGRLKELQQLFSEAGETGHEFPLIVKSRISRRDDLVALVRTKGELLALFDKWEDEEVVVQEHVASDGWDIKLWAVGRRIFAAHRPSPLDPSARRETIPVEEPPASWVRVLHEVRLAFALDLFGVDLLPTVHGPVIVDVNAFPGYRGIPGAAAALAAFAQALPRPTGDPLMCASSPMVPADAPVRLHAVRRKPGKGLIVIAEEARTRGPSIPVRWEVAVNERNLVRKGVGAALDAVLATLSGDSHGDELEVSLQRFPEDPGLPTLEAALSVGPGTVLWQALSAAAANDGERLTSVIAEPVRHKPGSRCVIAYRLGLRGATGTRRQTIYGKVFADLGEAHALDAVLERLKATAAVADAWSLPTALGVVEPLRLTLCSDAAPAGARDGLGALRPERVRTPTGQRASARIPVPTLDAIARGLARLHDDGRSPAGLPERSASGEAERARGRGELLANHTPQLAALVRATAAAVADALLAHPGGKVRICHGGFKASQLLVAPRGRVAVTDWDGACAADPALDLGYFCAYLRPPSLWAERAGARGWFLKARQRLMDTYAAEAARLELDAAEVRSRRQRAGAYEAALLLKIATRRVNRLNAPRPAELAAMCAEARRCLESATWDDVAEVA